MTKIVICPACNDRKKKFGEAVEVFIGSIRAYICQRCGNVFAENAGNEAEVQEQ